MAGAVVEAEVEVEFEVELDGDDDGADELGSSRIGHEGIRIGRAETKMDWHGEGGLTCLPSSLVW